MKKTPKEETLEFIEKQLKKEKQKFLDGNNKHKLYQWETFLTEFTQAFDLLNEKETLHRKEFESKNNEDNYQPLFSVKRR